MLLNKETGEDKLAKLQVYVIETSILASADDSKYYKTHQPETAAASLEHCCKN